MGWDILFDILNVEEQVVASLHADLEFDQIDSEGGAVFERGLAQPVVWSLIFTHTHV